MKKRLIALMLVLLLLPLAAVRAQEAGYAELMEDEIYACIGPEQNLTITSFVSPGGRGGYCQALYRAELTGNETKEQLDQAALQLVKSGAEPVRGGGKRCYHGGSYTVEPEFAIHAGTLEPGSYLYVCYAIGCAGGSYNHDLTPYYEQISTMAVRVTDSDEARFIYTLTDAAGNVLAEFADGETVTADLNWGSVYLHVGTEQEYAVERVRAVEAESEAFRFDGNAMVLEPMLCGSGTLRFQIEGYADGAQVREETVQIEYPCAPQAELTVLQENTCEEDGLAAYLCHGYGVSCETMFEEQILDALGHDLFSVNQIIEKPKATLPGLGSGTCKRCGLIGAEQELPPIFTDVSAEAFYSRALDYCYEESWVTGVAADTFGPDSGCQRGQVVTFLWRAAGEPEPENPVNPFEDVKAGSYYYQAVLWAAENGITAGVDESHFDPTGVCSRAQVVTFLHRAFGEPEASVTEHPFTDVKESGYYYGAMLWAVEEGITSGMTETTFVPGDPCTRAQIVTFLYRAYAE